MKASPRNKIYRIGALWTTVALLAGGAIVYAANRPAADEQPASPQTLDDIELVATATSFDEFDYSGENNLLRGNFIGSLFSTVQACQASRMITVFRVKVHGSAPDLPIATSISDNSGSTGNFTTTEFHDPPTEGDQYYAVVAPDEEKDCAGATSDTIEV